MELLSTGNHVEDVEVLRLVTLSTFVARITPDTHSFTIYLRPHRKRYKDTDIKGEVENIHDITDQWFRSTLQAVQPPFWTSQGVRGSQIREQVVCTYNPAPRWYLGVAGI